MAGYIIHKIGGMSMLRKILQTTLVVSLVLIVSGFQSGLRAEHSGVTKFKVRIENISNPDGQTASNGAKWPFTLSPGVWVVHGKNAPLFTTGKHDRGKGLEAQSEDGNPEMLSESLKKQSGVKSSGVFNTPVGATAPGPIGPGKAYEFTFTATPGSRLSFAMMFGQSNDLFYAPSDTGIALYDKRGKPISGDITSKVSLWDVGTEVNEEPGIGPNQGPRQSAPNTGPEEHEAVQLISAVHDGFTYPKTSNVIRITITPEGNLQGNSM
jgi:hypothetical protein